MADRPGLLREAIRRPLPLETFGRPPVRRGETFALPASLPVRVRAGRSRSG